MATKKKGVRRRARRVQLSEVVMERIRSLDDAVRSALESIEEHEPAAIEIVSTALFGFAANIVWHDTIATEEEFVSAARDCFRRVAQAHANCARAGEGGEETEHRHTRLEDLN